MNNVTGLTVTPDVNALTLQWSPVAGATGYKVYRQLDGNFVLIANIPGTTFKDEWITTASAWSYAWSTDTGKLGLPKGVTQYYLVTAYDGSSESGGTNTSGTPIADTLYVIDKVRATVNIIAYGENTGAWSTAISTVANLTKVHDWIRTNFTTNITLYVDIKLLTTNVGSDATIYLQSLVAAYGYDIVTLPHRAWFPTIDGWWGGYTGTAAEIANIQTAHDSCFTVFGKYPVASYAWHYNSALAEKAASLGYKLCPGGISEQAGVDGFRSIGNPWGFYKPSKNNNLMPGDGTAENTHDIIAGLAPLKTGSYRTNFEYYNNLPETALDFCGDIWKNLTQQKNTFKKVIEDSDLDINGYFVTPFYIDSYWLFLDPTYTSYATDGSGDTEQWRAHKNIMQWFKDRYGADKVVKTGDLGTWLQTKIDNTKPCPPVLLWGYNDIEGHESEKGWRYDCANYHAMCQFKAGAAGYIRFIQELPYNSTNTEAVAPQTNWSSTGGVLRNTQYYDDGYESGTEGWFFSQDPPAREIQFVRSGITYSLHDGSDINISEGFISSTVSKAIACWHIFDNLNTTLLFTFVSEISEDSLINSYINRNASVTSIVEYNNLTAQTVELSQNTELSQANLIFSTQPSVQSTTENSAIIAYSTLELGANQIQSVQTTLASGSLSFQATVSESQTQNESTQAELQFTGTVSESKANTQSAIATQTITGTITSNQLTAQSSEGTSAVPTIAFSQQPTVLNGVIYYGTEDLFAGFEGVTIQLTAQQQQIVNASLGFAGTSIESQETANENALGSQVFSGGIVGYQLNQGQTLVQELEGVTQAQGSQQQVILSSLGFMGVASQEQAQRQNAIELAEVLALSVSVRDPLELSIAMRDPLALTVTVN